MINERIGDPGRRLAAMCVSMTASAAFRPNPSGSVDRPLLIAVHGSGRDNLDTAAALPCPRCGRISILAPLFPATEGSIGGDGYKFLREPGVDYVTLLDRMIERAAADHGFDRARVYLSVSRGHSSRSVRSSARAAWPRRSSPLPARSRCSIPPCPGGRGSKASKTQSAMLRRRRRQALPDSLIGAADRAEIVERPAGHPIIHHIRRQDRPRPAVAHRGAGGSLAHTDATADLELVPDAGRACTDRGRSRQSSNFDQPACRHLATGDKPCFVDRS